MGPDCTCFITKDFFFIQNTMNIVTWQTNLCFQPRASNLLQTNFLLQTTRKWYETLKITISYYIIGGARPWSLKWGKQIGLAPQSPSFLPRHNWWTQGQGAESKTAWQSPELRRKKSFGVESEVAGICWGKAVENIKCPRQLHGVPLWRHNGHFSMLTLKFHETGQRAHL